jgi:hypothetical protein
VNLFRHYLKRLIIRILDIYNKERLEPTRFNVFLEKVMIWIEYNFWADFHHPKTWTEFIIWKKFYGDYEKLANVSDKIAVREFVKEKIGPEYLAKVYDIVDSEDEIDREKYTAYPEKFVIKPNMASKRVFINKEKNYELFRDSIDGFTDEFGNRNNEFHYKRLPPKLLVEEWFYSKVVPLQEYKCWVFHGRVELISHSFNIYESEKTNSYRYRIYDRNWQKPAVQFRKNLEKKYPVPEKLAEIIYVAEELAAGWDFLRVDLYVVDNMVKFGELTPIPSAGRSFFFNLNDQEYVYKRLCSRTSYDLQKL